MGNPDELTAERMLKLKPPEQVRCASAGWPAGALCLSRACTLPAPQEEKIVESAAVPASLEGLTYLGASSLARLMNNANARAPDFVFGHELGRGSFSSVQYAKRIEKCAAPP
jgi:hypothetical protein